MSYCFNTLAVAAAVLSAPLLGYCQISTGRGAQSAPQAQAARAGDNEAARMAPAIADLVKPVDSKKDQPGAAVQARITHKVSLPDGTELPAGAVLIGEVTADDMRQEGMSKLALRFHEARLKNGTTVPVKATIVGFYGPGTKLSDEGTALPGGMGEERPNTWTATTTQIDQVDVDPGVDLHSRIASESSGVFVATKKDDVKLKAGSELQLAIGPGSSASASASAATKK